MTPAHDPDAPIAVDPADDLAFVDRVVAEAGRGPESLIPILHALQRRYRFLPEPSLRRVCETTEITPAAVAGVASFFNQFRLRPMGRHLVRCCHGTACHVKGAPLVTEKFEQQLRIPAGSDTDPAGFYTVQKVACLGCCTLAPVVQIDEVTYGHVAPERVGRVLRDFEAVARQSATPAAALPAEAGAAAGEIRIGLGSCCMAKGSHRVYDALRTAAAGTGAAVSVRRVGCVGMCYQTPIVEIDVPGREPAVYTKVTPDAVAGIVRRHFRPPSAARRAWSAFNALLEDLATGEAWDPERRHPADVRDPAIAAFFGRQKHIATEHFGRLDPLDLDGYWAHGGFRALDRVLAEQEPGDVVEQVKRSGLRGRGGAGFPSGLKWEKVRASRRADTVLICNGDEGDPGAFMDRMILESFPYRVIEGMAIAAYAVGAAEGIFYIRAEYPLAVERVREALRRCEKGGLLDRTARTGPFRLRLQIREGAGAFVCGEETAMIASLEGRRGTPRHRPPYPAESGLHGRPTLINNVETLACVPWILRNGPDAFAALGTASSRGTKVFALAGKVERGGLIEVPMGTTIREIVEEIGGGAAGGKPWKAVQIGGPSGGCLPASLADTPVDYEALTAAGAMMGSGGLVVLDGDDCMVDIARYFLQFTQSESCGKCTCCRVGTRRLLELLDRICAGQGRAGDLEDLERLARTTSRGSLCGLGRTAPNPVLTTLRYFRDEYEAHLQGRCPARRCRPLIRYTITDACTGCTICAQHCPVNAIPATPFEKHAIDQATCTKCDTCRVVCPAKAVEVS
jgi:NADH-quinone oxidoreductase subunit F